MFLDGLKAELEGAEARPVAGGSRTNALNKLHDKIADLRFLDPACGSGNFLTETYLELRRIENRILADLDKDGQLALDLGDDINPVKVSISHFHGIEINGFACAVARTALWIAEQQALDDTESTISGLPRLPFTDTAHIRQGNALRLDWNELLPGDHCDYVMGNPPFIGQYLMSDSQKEDMRLIWDKGYDGYLDYATGWHRKASEYLAKPGAAFAFVSTNSISQGQPVPSLFRPCSTRDGASGSRTARSPGTPSPPTTRTCMSSSSAWTKRRNRRRSCSNTRTLTGNQPPAPWTTSTDTCSTIRTCSWRKE